MLWAVFAAVAAAVLFGVASVLEQRNAKRVRPRGALSPRLMVDLLKRPGFVGALVVNALGSVLQIVALHFGSLAVVQPLVVLNLLFAVVIAAVTVRRRPPDRVLLAGTVCCAAGVGCFLAVARPGGGSGTVGTGSPADPGQGETGVRRTAMTGQRTIRASDQDRERVTEVLCDAFAAGCLDGSELEQRSGAAYRARTLGELWDLTADLPGWLLNRPVPLPHEYRCRRPRRPAALWGFIIALAVFWPIAVAMAWAPLAAVPVVLVWLLVMVRAQGWVPRSSCRRPGRPGLPGRSRRPG